MVAPPRRIATTSGDSRWPVLAGEDGLVKNRDWLVIFGVFFLWMLAQSLIRAAVGALPGLIIGILGLVAIAAVMWLVVRRRKARALAAEAETEDPEAL